MAANQGRHRGEEQRVRICQLASGSKGNALYVESGQTRILVDGGLSARALEQRLATIGVAGHQLDAVFLTHEHGDHSLGVGPLCRRFDLPLYAVPQTLAALPRLGRVRCCLFEPGQALEFQDLRLESFCVTHDAVAPVGFVIEGQRGRLGLATDLGVATRLVQDRLQGCQALILEANHDEQLLHDGPYPWPLKQRIRSRHGHLSNCEAAELLQSLLWPGLQTVVLAHLSETNNRPELARQSVASVLQPQNICRPQLLVAGPLTPMLWSLAD
ncbi:MBL fold metallo-hydrolase [Desulfuromonas thiophila]|uniref:MBL fold metallo-hydrolase n=1 Tax=Desulfuromonas thiophila TaxID=57664 RepID=UPI0029F54C65|nr:MBL fold metallo-hydrolase [Desulfuromonas thiophila]